MTDCAVPNCPRARTRETTLCAVHAAEVLRAEVCPADWLVEQNTALRVAGCKLAEAALYVIREYDGVHRLAAAVAEWSQAIADEGGRGQRHGDERLERRE